jgi:hypothetical protein
LSDTVGCNRPEAECAVERDGVDDADGIIRRGETAGETAGDACVDEGLERIPRREDDDDGARREPAGRRPDEEVPARLA